MGFKTCQDKFQIKNNQIIGNCPGIINTAKDIIVCRLIYTEKNVLFSSSEEVELCNYLLGSYSINLHLIQVI